MEYYEKNQNDESLPEIISNKISSDLRNQSKSTAFENLISQNDDLMIRMKVVLKRLVAFEDENLRLLTENKEIKNQLTSIGDQISIYKDKQFTYKDRALAAEEALDLNNSQIRQKEIEFAQLRNHDLKEKEKLKNHIEKINRKFSFLSRYHARINLYIKPIFKNYKKTIKDQNKIIQGQLSVIDQCKLQTHQALQQNTILIQSHHHEIKKLEDQKIQIIAQFEKQKSDHTREIESIQKLNYELERKASQLNDALERQDQLENKLIMTERTFDDYKHKTNLDIENIQKQLFYWRNHGQKLEIENKTAINQTVEMSQSLITVTDLNQKLQEQLDAMRHLWENTSKENQRLLISNQSLEKLNAELSIKMNELRQCSTKS